MDTMRRRLCLNDTVKDFCAAGLEQKSATDMTFGGRKVGFEEISRFKRVGFQKPQLAGIEKLKESASHHL